MTQLEPHSTELTDGAHREPRPVPRALLTLVNPVLKVLLLSPFHGRFSRRLMVLSFTGRRTGRRYATPVGYVRHGSSVLVFNHSAWRYNFTAPAPVRMRIQGKDVAGRGQWVTDPARIRTMLRLLIAANGPEMSQRMGFWIANPETASEAEIQRATAGTYFIEIQTEAGAQ